MQIITDLKSTQQKTLQYFELPEEALNKTYASGKWTVRQLLLHIADAESVLYDRIRRGISKPGQVVWAFDQDAWCQGLDYQNKPLTIDRELYNAVRNAVIYTAEQFYESHGNNQFVHSETGLRTVKDEIEKVVWHNEHHLQQIEQAINLNC